MRHWKAVAAACLIGFAMNVSFADGIKLGAPEGWQLWGPLGDKYEMGIDPAESTPDHPALVIASKDTPTNETVTLMQQVNAAEWEGGMIEFSMMAKAVGAEKNRVWLRHLKGRNPVTGEKRSLPELMLNSRSIPDSKGWERITIISYLPKDSGDEDRHFDIGISLASKGKIWVRDIKLERKPFVPVSNPVELPAFRMGLPTYPPRNLNFSG
ncbi:hypothetical protein H8L32_08905 [Undibacterium sp. CY18W]|uniref:Uncharacterized protein n=1 Tax=Undibacterium hunanense TaxID=2762292 RepID=A0ABR6ZPU8_9BURK|nr:hypothetical protein [Undibacterium hunanense]MBC3917588.1 hypothetical protein [Undibacterium hunanense]